MTEPEPRLPWHSLPLSSVGLSAGALRALVAAGYTTLGEVAVVPPAELARVKGLERRNYRKLRQLIEEHRNAHARELLSTGMSLRQAAERLGVSHATLRRWAKSSEKKANNQA